MSKEKCESLAEARNKIDAIDEAIIEWIGLRQFYVDQAVRFKHSVQDIQAPERVDMVLNKVRTLAGQNQLDPELVENIYKQMMQHFVQRELREFRP